MTTALTRATSSRPASTAALRTAAIGASGILLGFAGLQVALAAGAPLGEHVWGGTQDRVLPTGMRAVAGAAALALTVAAATVARRAGLIGRPAYPLSPATWAISGYLALNTVGNLASSSGVARWVFGLATAVASAPHRLRGTSHAPTGVGMIACGRSRQRSTRGAPTLLASVCDTEW